MIWKVISDVL